ncbi:MULTISPECIES: hypothetical protein [Streptomyces]|uniref:hypothetical protein n=1 Tax=Streptomyces TaxID=1883 RepID=UPI00131EBCEC|nr:hypothetical protein [Streptomyces sp. CFMR 7]
MELAEVARILGGLLGVRLEERESSYRGGAYFRGELAADGEVLVQLNWADEDGELAEPEFPEFVILVYVNSVSAEMAGSISASGKLSLLREEVL